MNQQLSSLAACRVVDLSDEWGQFAGVLLAQLGAEVVRVEPPEGHFTRRIGPFHRREDGWESLYYWHFNRGKKSVVCDAGSPDGAARLRGLLAAARLVIAGRASLEQLRGTCPAELGRVPCIAITPYGLAQPDRGRDDELHVAALSGAAGLCGYGWEEDSAPVMPGGEQAAHVASLHGAMAAFLALRLGAAGAGRVFDVSAQAALFQSTEQLFSHWVYRREHLHRRTGGYATAASTARWQYTVADGGLVYAFGLLPRSQREWEKLRTWMAQEGAVEDLYEPAYDDVTKLRGRSSFDISPEGQHALQVIATFVQSLGAEQAYREGQARGLAWARIFRPEETLDDAHFHERSFFQWTEPAAGGDRFLVQALPWIAGAERTQEVVRPPRLGEHTEEILRAWRAARD